jgi:hypothetical protein
MSLADCPVRFGGGVLVAGCMTLLPSRVDAQADRYAPTILQIAPTPRAATLASTTAARDIEAIFANPAMVGVAVGTIVSLGRFDAATQLTLASSASLGPFSVGIGAQYLDHVSQNIGLPFWSYALQVGGERAASSVAGAFALATTIRGNRVGAAVKYVGQRSGPLRDHAPSLDLGIARDVSRYTVGLTVQNIGAGVHLLSTRAQLPLRVAAGVSSYGWAVGPFDVNGSAGASVLPDGIVLPALGLELGYVPMEGYNFALRAGIRRPELRAQQPLSIGGTAGLDRFALEYAYEDWVNGAVHRLALRVR